MTPETLALLIGLACFAANMALSLTLLRVPGRVSPVVRLTASALGTHIAVVLLAARFGESFPYWPTAAVAAFGAVCWLFAFCAVYKSVSLRILTELSRAPGQVITFEAITVEYVLPEFEARAALLVAMGKVERTDDGYAVTEAGLAAARRIEAVQAMCGIANSGMYGEPDADAPDSQPMVTRSAP